MRHPRDAGLGTRAVHPPRREPQSGLPVSPLLDLSSTYAFDDIEQFAAASDARAGAGYVYGRWANPTTDLFEASVADLEGMDEAEAFATGMAAVSSVFLALCSSGDRVVSTRQLYGNTYSLLATRLPRYGIETTFCDVTDHDAIAAALPGARLLYCETIGNPRIAVADLPALADMATDADVPLVVDNTFASPVLCRPAEHGATITLHSATKFLGGHHDLMGGVICGSAETLAPIKELAIDLGPTLSPFASWLALRGIATLHLRVPRSSDSALQVARALEQHPAVEEVYYPALESSPDRKLADVVLGGRGGGTIGLSIAGGRERARAFQEHLRLVMPAASLGGTHSLIVHAASVTHTQLSPEELAAAGMSQGFCRLSVGLEDPEDIVEDLCRALDAVP